MDPQVRRFACTQCGKCCNRSPEVQLSEAASLADVFVFRLMFRLYWLSNLASDYVAEHGAAANATAVFYEKKRLLGAFAARKYPAKVQRGPKAIQCTKYLMISALALDTSPGSCSALKGHVCSIYDRRPLTCRSVPFPYSRGESLAEAGLKAFVETPGYRCDTGETAEIVLSDGKIVAQRFNDARAEAQALAERDRRWSDAIVRRMSARSSEPALLPTLQEIEANAHFAVTTISMRAAWQIAGDAGLIGSDDCDRLTELQLQVIDRDLARMSCSNDARQMLLDMRAEYRRDLKL